MSDVDKNVIPMVRTQSLAPNDIEGLRLQVPEEEERTVSAMMHPEINLFADMYEAGPVWAEAHASRYYGKDHPENKRRQIGRTMADAMTLGIQEEYAIRLSDDEIGRMHGMAREFATIALGGKIDIPNLKKPFRQPMRTRPQIVKIEQNDTVQKLRGDIG